MNLIEMYCICSLKCAEIYENLAVKQHNPILTYKFKYVVDALNRAIPYRRGIPIMEVDK